MVAIRHPVRHAFPRSAVPASIDIAIDKNLQVQLLVVSVPHGGKSCLLQQENLVPVILDVRAHGPGIRCRLVLRQARA